MSVTNRTTDFSAGQLKSLLGGVRLQKFTGISRIALQNENGDRSPERVFAWKDGELTLGGEVLPTLETLSQSLAEHFNRNMIATATSFSKNKMQDQSSVRELAEMLVRLRVLKWEELKAYALEKTVLALEQVLMGAGRMELDEVTVFDLTYGAEASSLDWIELFAGVGERFQIWHTLTPGIPSMWAVPQLSQAGLATITDPNAREQIAQWVDGKRSLVDIARETPSDPIDIARTYLSWAETGWIEFEGGAAAKNAESQIDLPVILSVDDSPIVQTTIKRSLADHYKVLLASNAMEALNILNREQVKLLLLDVTMPVIDGLEFCKTLRKIPKFKALPIVMLTARDGNVNKMKGQIAGTNRYLTKPVAKDDLLEIVGEYVR